MNNLVLHREAACQILYIHLVYLGLEIDRQAGVDVDLHYKIRRIRLTENWGLAGFIHVVSLEISLNAKSEAKRV